MAEVENENLEAQEPETDGEEALEEQEPTPTDDEGFTDDPHEVLPLNWVEAEEPEKEETEEPQEPESEEKESSEEAEPSEEEPEAEDQPAEEENELDKVALTLDGRKYTGSEIIGLMQTDPKMAVRILTRAEQAPHWQALYNQIRESGAVPPQAQPQQPQQPQPQVNPAEQITEMLHQYRPRAEQLVEMLRQVADDDDPIVDGLATTLELNPGLLASIIFLTDQVTSLQGVMGMMMPVVQEQGMSRFQEARDQRLAELVNQTAAEIPDLADPGVQQRMIAALQQDEVLNSIDPRALFSDEASPFVDRLIRGLLWSVLGNEGTPQPKPKNAKKRARRASGPPSGSRSKRETTGNLRERLFTG